MTIKQHGGVFGRNPTFNDVYVERNLTVGGSALPSVGNIAVLDTAQTFTEKQTLSKAGSTFDIFSFEYTGAGDRVTIGLDTFNSIVKMFAGNGNQTVQLSSGGANNSFFKGVDVEIHNANLVMATAGNGIDFSATGDGSGTTSSELFDDYEEGTWTPTVTSGGSVTTGSATYIKIGRQVTLFVSNQMFSDITTASAITIGGIPYATSSLGVGSMFAQRRDDTVAFHPVASGTTVLFYKNSSTGSFANLLHTDLSNATLNSMYWTVTYIAS